METMSMLVMDDQTMESFSINGTELMTYFKEVSAFQNVAMGNKIISMRNAMMRTMMMTMVEQIV